LGHIEEILFSALCQNLDIFEDIFEGIGMIQATGNLEIYCNHLIVKNRETLVEENDQNCLFNIEEDGWNYNFKTMTNPIEQIKYYKGNYQYVLNNYHVISQKNSIYRHALIFTKNTD
jgi:hypothetical protein